MSAEPTPPEAPLLRVVRGEPTAEEVAALLAVVSAAGRDLSPAPRRTPTWSLPTRLHREVPAHGVGGWRASGLPR